MAFGVFDPSGLPTGLNVTYTWNVSPNGDPGQCQVPITYQVGYGQFGPIIVDDSDNRLGYCNLSFNVYASSNFALDIQYYAGPGGSAGQCVNALPQGQFYTASAGAPVTLSLDTDNRPAAAGSRSACGCSASRAAAWMPPSPHHRSPGSQPPPSRTARSRPGRLPADPDPEGCR